VGSSSFRRIFVIAGITALVLSYIGLWIRLINDPVERTGADFIHFYSAGRVAQRYGISHVYNLELQQEVEEEQVGFDLAPGQVLPFNHLPFLIPILEGLMSENYVASFYRWDFLMSALFVLGIGILSQSLKQTGLDRNSILVAAVGGFLFLPVFVSLQNGQDTALVFLGTAIWVYGLFSGRDMFAGVGLSLTTARPHIALMLAIPMLICYRKVFLGFLFGTGVLAVFSVLLLGVDGTKEFINILILTAGGNWYGTHQEAMLNLIGLLLRTLPLEANTIRLIGWIFYGIAIIVLCMLWSRKGDLQDGRLGLTVTLAVFAVPHLHFHDLALLLIPIYELIRFSTQSGKFKKEIAVVLSIAISILLLGSNITPFLHYSIPYLIMLGLAVYPYYFQHQSTSAVPHRS
jgi:hypothetical protein